MAAAAKAKKFSLDDTQLEPFTVVVAGNVDSGKSTTVGVLTSGIHDDGNGSARQAVLKHPHERQRGQTSDISCMHSVDGDRVYTFIDLAGHESYLRTTIRGITSGHADLAIVCVSNKITKMTTEHIGLILALNIPLMLVFTKIDAIDAERTQTLTRELQHMLRRTAKKRKLFHIRGEKDILMVGRNNSIIPYVQISNKTGDGISLLRKKLKECPTRDKNFVKGFCVERLFNVMGIGSVVTGTVGEKIQKGDVLYLGPKSDGTFIKVKARSLHNDYRYEVQELTPGKRGCVSISLPVKEQRHIRSGMVMMHAVPQIAKRFSVLIQIFHHSTSILPGYSPHINCGAIAATVKFVTVQKTDKTGALLEVGADSAVRTGDYAHVVMEFVNRVYYIEPGHKLFFREGKTMGCGMVLKILPHE